MITPGFAYNIARYFPSGTDYDKNVYRAHGQDWSFYKPFNVVLTRCDLFATYSESEKKKCINFFVVIHSCSVSNANTTEKRPPFKKPSAKECHAIAHQRYRAFLHDYKPKRIQGCLWLSSRKCKVKVASPSLATEVKNLRVA